MLYFEAMYTFLLSKYCMTCFSKYNKNEHLKSTYVCSKGFTCLLSYPLTLLVVASLFIYTSFCFFQGSPWWQERPVYGTITALRNSFSIHGEITHFKVNKTNWIFEITPTYLISFVDLCFFCTARWSPATSCWWTRSCELECLLSKVKGQQKKLQLFSYSQG